MFSENFTSPSSRFFLLSAPPLERRPHSYRLQSRRQGAVEVLRNRSSPRRRVRAKSTGAGKSTPRESEETCTHGSSVPLPESEDCRSDCELAVSHPTGSELSQIANTLREDFACDAIEVMEVAKARLDHGEQMLAIARQKAPRLGSIESRKLLRQQPPLFRLVLVRVSD